jgi:hypothetical protein
VSLMLATRPTPPLFYKNIHYISVV